MTRQEFLKLAAAGAVSGAALANAQQAGSLPAVTPADLGFKDTPMEPDTPWHVHDPDRPHAKVVVPSNTPYGPPSDALVLFDGKDLSQWGHRVRGPNAGQLAPAGWKVENGYFEVTRGFGDLLTKEKFGDVQLHMEWASPTVVDANSQGRGNSGVLFMARYEIQVLDAWNNPTYADGAAGAIYGQYPPLALPARKPGEWNTYDIVFEAPKFDAGNALVKPAFFTVFYNGVLVHNRKQSLGPMVYRQVAHYTPHPAEDSLMLQYHNNPVRYRNIWVRRLAGYDVPEKA